MRNSTRSLLILIFSAFVFADDYHYKSVLIGERAIGLGGAYVAISDDPSAVYYNPAGLRNARAGQFNATANAFHSTENRYRNIAPGQDFATKSSGFIPSYFGFTDRLMNFEIAFLVAVPQSELIDQRDDIKHFSADLIDEISIKLAQKNSLYHVGGAVAVPIVDGLSLGVSLVGVGHFVSVVNMQYTTFHGGKYTFKELSVATEAYGLLGRGGLLYQATPDLKLGLTLSYLTGFGGSGQGKIIQTNTDDNGVPIVPTGTAASDVVITDIPNLYYRDPETLNGSLGVSYQLAEGLVLSTELDYFGVDIYYASYKLRPTFNWSVGVEYYVTPKVPLRLGLYSDNANSHPLSAGGMDQAPHVNLVGSVLTASLVDAKTSTTIGLSYALGTGSAQQLAQSPAIQVLHQKTLIVYLSGSYQL